MSASKGHDDGKGIQKTFSEDLRKGDRVESQDQIEGRRFFLDAEIGIKFALHARVYGHVCMYACVCAIVGSC
jgi:hypothetical protein